MTDTLTSEPTPAAPRLAPGIELIGEYQDSGFKEAAYLARRADGQVIQLSRLLYLVAAWADGQRSLEEIASGVSEEFGRTLTADNVKVLIEAKLRPLGVIAAEDGSVPEQLKRANPLLGLRFRVGLVPERAVRAITAVFWPLFLPPVVVATLGGLIAFDIWLFFHHGLLKGVEQVLYQPALIFAFFVIETLQGSFHECGHASACRYGGAKPGKMGVGIYLVFFVYYSDVTDSYRLNKLGRLRTDLGGIYFDCIFSLAMAGTYFLTGFEPLLLLAFFTQLDALDEFTPFARFDGYYVISDWIGVPDLFSRIKPIVMSLIPGRQADERVTEMKPWARAVVTVWVLTTVPVLLISLGILVVYGPTLLSTALSSLSMQWGVVSRAYEVGSTVEVLAGLTNILILVFPLFGVALFVGFIALRLPALARRRWSGAAAEGATAEAAATEGATTEGAAAEGGSAPRLESRGDGGAGRRGRALLDGRLWIVTVAVVAVALGLGLFFSLSQGSYGSIPQLERANPPGDGALVAPGAPEIAPDRPAQPSQAPPNGGKATTDGGVRADEPSREDGPDTGQDTTNNAAAAPSPQTTAPAASSPPPSDRQASTAAPANNAAAAPSPQTTAPAASSPPPSDQQAPTAPREAPAPREPTPTTRTEPANSTAAPPSNPTWVAPTPIEPSTLGKMAPTGGVESPAAVDALQQTD